MLHFWFVCFVTVKDGLGICGMSLADFKYCVSSLPVVRGTFLHAVSQEAGPVHLSSFISLLWFQYCSANLTKHGMTGETRLSDLSLEPCVFVFCSGKSGQKYRNSNRAFKVQ